MGVLLANKDICTGCMACLNACNHSAIKIKENDEGFPYPCIDDSKCLECGLCVKHCPVLTPIEVKTKPVNAYAVISYPDREVSSSGGAFSMFARWTIENNGVVFGAAMDSDCSVKHIAIETLDELKKLRGSKYVQSNIGNTYQEAKRFLKNGRQVLFTGTGCQIAGLYAYLKNKRYDGELYTLDLICHGVPSPGAFKAYLGKIIKSPRLKGCGRNIEGFSFRKLDSWIISPAVKFAKAKEQILNLSDNAYMNAFFKGLIFRECCYHCPYCNINRVGTYTIADFWGIGKYGTPFKKNVACGVSLLIDNQGTFENIRDNFKDSYIERRSLEEALHEQMNLKKPMPRPIGRDTAVLDMIDSKQSLDDFCEKYGLPYKATLKSILLFSFKKFVVKAGLLNFYVTIKNKITSSI